MYMFKSNVCLAKRRREMYSTLTVERGLKENHAHGQPERGQTLSVISVSTYSSEYRTSLRTLRDIIYTCKVGRFMKTVVYTEETISTFTHTVPLQPSPPTFHQLR
jgi:hypothetical protein